MSFKQFKASVKHHFEKVMSQYQLFVIEVDKDEMWDTYLKSFPEGTNPIFRVRTEADCSICRHFIKALGNVCYIKDGVLHTFWELQQLDSKYAAVAEAMDRYIKSHTMSLRNVFITDTKKIGVDVSTAMYDDKVFTFEHLFAEVPNKFIFSGRSTIDTWRADFRTKVSVFKSSLENISMEALDTVIEIISQGSLYKGEEWLKALKEFKQLKKEYSSLRGGVKKHLYVWEKAAGISGATAKIKNHSIGVLLTDISDGMDLEEAVRKYEVIVAPANYKRPKAIFTKAMLDKAKKDIESLGYMESLERRLATLDDITVNNILFSNKDSAKRIEGGSSLFDNLEKKASSKPKSFKHVEKVSIDKFIKDILPTATEVEAYVENRHKSNFVSLIAPKNKDAKSMFKWNNNFSWAYTGNVTDSLKENVKKAGGRIDGFMRFSIQWNEEPNGGLGNDLDAHCSYPSGEIFFASKRHPAGSLDVDITRPNEDVAVENIIFPGRSKLPAGKYRFFVHTYAYRGETGGFRAQIELNGQIYNYNYNKRCKEKEEINVAEVYVDKYKEVEIKHLLEPGEQEEKSVECWGVNTCSFVPVSVVMYSPNYWDEQTGIGHKHYFFMLKDCVNPEEPNGFYNEFLHNDLNVHKHVFEALGRQAKVEAVSDQLSGIGFSSTKRAELTVKVKGSTERVVTIQF